MRGSVKGVLATLALLCGCRWDVVIGSDGLALSTDDAGAMDASTGDVAPAVDAVDVVAVDRGFAPDRPDVPVVVDVPEVPMGTIRAVAIGGDFLCIVRSEGSVWCRGDNTHGALGDGTTAATSEQVRVQGIGPVASMVAGRRHACAMLSAGGVRCWGANDRGQLGDGTTIDRPTPVAPAGIPDVEAVTAGAAHTCVRTGVVVRCAGANEHGQLGDGTGTDRATFVPVSGTYGRVEAGGAFTLAETAGGMLVAWGANDHGQLGDGTTTDRPMPGAVAGAAAAGRVLAVGDAHALARVADGTTYAWGDNAQGALGDGSTTERRTPVEVAAWRESTSVRAGRGFTCGDGTAVAMRCTGANDLGQVGDDSGMARSTPVVVAVSPRGPVAFKAAGFDRACAAPSPAELWCWGDNALGQLGPAAETRQLRPVLVGR